MNWYNNRLRLNTVVTKITSGVTIHSPLIVTNILSTDKHGVAIAEYLATVIMLIAGQLILYSQYLLHYLNFDNCGEL